MTMLNTASSWNVGRTTGRCAACGAELPPNAICWAALCDGGKIPAPEAVKVKSEAAKGKKEEVVLPSPFMRIDFCESCWSQGRRPENLPPAAAEPETPLFGARLTMFSFWKTSVPVPEQKKKLLVDDSVLVDVFSRMEGKAEPQEVRFRFVLALILMRKRLLKYEGMEEARPLVEAATSATDPAAPASPAPRPPETWRMTPRGSEQSVLVINPHLTAEQIVEVSQQLSAILAEEV